MFSIVLYLRHLEKRVGTNLIPTEHSPPNRWITYVWLFYIICFIYFCSHPPYLPHQINFAVAPQGGITINSKQVVLITGSSTGFGRLFADTLARKGHIVFATMRDPGGRNAKNASEIRTLAEKDSLPIYVLHWT
jgi:hypothetical protein